MFTRIYFEDASTDVLYDFGAQFFAKVSRIQTLRLLR